MQSAIQMGNVNPYIDIKKTNIFESDIYMDDDDDNNNKNNSPKNKIKNKSAFPFKDLPGMSLKGSIMPFGGIPEEENEDFGSYNDSNKQSSKNNLKKSEFEFGGAYLGDDDDENDNIEEIPIKEEKKENKKNMKKSSVLGMSLNNNIFGFNNNDDYNEIYELKKEINDLYKKRDKMEDELNDKDEKLKQSMINIGELNKIIEQKNKEIEDLKKK